MKAALFVAPHRPLEIAHVATPTPAANEHSIIAATATPAAVRRDGIGQRRPMSRTMVDAISSIETVVVSR